ncbi:carboxypeptidase regulatory-like domain-containing protein [Pontibacter chitinilyticus]|uniref:carboxypeptidase regulatory-like domain-containing protein n=1 Tax=Pontibacter chitinilyticus TaxID=2674989 RepID=UPI00321C334C
MDKLLLLPLALLLSCCSSTKPASTGTNQSEQQMEQSQAPAQQPGQVIGAPASASSQQVVPVSQGIAGKVLWKSGNQMPSPDAPPSQGRGVQRTVYVYELTNASQATAVDGVFYTNLKTNLVAQVETDADGSFSVNLQPGTYSLFTKEEKGLFASIFDGEMNINPVEVQKGQVTNVELVINYRASY